MSRTFRNPPVKYFRTPSNKPNKINKTIFFDEESVSDYYFSKRNRMHRHIVDNYDDIQISALMESRWKWSRTRNATDY